MNIELLPTLQVQRELYAMPRGLDRFWKYVETLTGGTDDIAVPIVAMNPMGKEHSLVKIDELIAIDAERVATEAIAPTLGIADGIAWKLALVLVDDLMGGWTNRHANEFAYRTKPKAQLLRRPFIVVPMWTSETWDEARVREATLIEIYRTAHIVQHGDAKTLRELLAQEGEAMAHAGTTQWLDADDLDYTREVIAPHLNATDQPTLLTCLLGDEAANALGYSPMGLSKRAGLALALREAHPV